MSGDLAPGAQLPSTQQLVEQYDTANATVQRALAVLKDDGLVLGKAGKGVFVRDDRPSIVDVAAYFPPQPRGYRYRLLDVATVEPPADVVRALEQQPGGTAILRHRLMVSNDRPVELSWSYYPSEIAAGTRLAERSKIVGGAPRLLAELGSPQRSFTDQVSARLPTSYEIEQLDLPPDMPVIRQLRTVYSDGRRPVEASVLVKGAHLHELRYEQPISVPASTG